MRRLMFRSSMATPGRGKISRANYGSKSSTQASTNEANYMWMVGVGRFELPTSSSRTKRPAVKEVKLRWRFRSGFIEPHTRLPT